MGSYRKSYWKSVIISALAGAGSLFILSLLLFGHVLGIVPEMPPLLMWIAGLLLVPAAVVSFCITVGGFLALNYDSKGRAYF